MDANQNFSTAADKKFTLEHIQLFSSLKKKRLADMDLDQNYLHCLGSLFLSIIVAVCSLKKKNFLIGSILDGMVLYCCRQFILELFMYKIESKEEDVT